MLADLISGECLLPGLQIFVFMLYSHIGRENREKMNFFFSLFIRALISFFRAPLSLPNYLPKASPLNITTLWVRVSADDFERDTNIQAIAPSLTSSELMFRQASYSLDLQVIKVILLLCLVSKVCTSFLIYPVFNRYF